MLTKAISRIPRAIKNHLSRLENPTYSLTDPAAWDFTGNVSESGEPVTHRNALTLDSVFQAVTLISGDAASANVNVFRKEQDKDGNETQKIDTEHPADYLISVEANKEMSSFEYRRRLFAHALLWGNGYAFIDRSPSGKPISLLNLLPDRTMPSRDKNGDLFYITEVTGADAQRDVIAINPHDMIHLKGFSIDNEVACDLITKARNTIGLTMAAENFSSKFFAHGAMASGVLEIPTHFTQTAKDNLEEGWSKRGGKDNWFKTVILRDGSKFHQMTIDAQKSQLHELREDQVRAIARFFNLPPFKLGLTESISYNSTEQLQLIYLTGTLLHWLVEERTEYNLKLRTEPQKRRRTHLFKHDPSPLVELDQKTHNEVLQIQRQNLIITGNEWRREINRPPLTDPNANKLLNPNTLANQEEDNDDTDTDTEPPSPPPEEMPDEENRRIQMIAAHENLIAHNCGVAARRLCYDISRLAKNSNKFVSWIDTGLEENKTLFKTTFEPIVQSIAASYTISSEGLLWDLEDTFFKDIVNQLQSFTQAPYYASELPKHATAAANSFQNRIAGELLKTFTNSIDRELSNGKA